MDICFENKTEIELELVTDVDMLHIDCENEITTGITRANKHYAETNNKYMNNFDRSSFIVYLDFNIHYGHASSEPIP